MFHASVICKEFKMQWIGQYYPIQYYATQITFTTHTSTGSVKSSGDSSIILKDCNVRISFRKPESN